MTLRAPQVARGAIGSLLVRALGSEQPIAFERVLEGGSTPVYRVKRGQQTFYLRLAEAEGLFMRPEFEVHRTLQSLGVRVPEVIFYEPCDRALGYSAILTTEIRGTPLAKALATSRRGAGAAPC